jgi:hypothetical protein
MDRTLEKAYRSFRAQPRLVRVFAYVLFAVLVISGLSGLGDFYRGFSKGLEAGLHRDR